MAIWKLDPAHTSANFSVRHMMVTTVRGQFSKVEGTVNFDPENPENASVEAQIDASSISTNNVDRDAHLRSADFLLSDEHPYITFKSTKIEVTGENGGKITGDLSIRGVTRQVTLDTEYFGTGKNPYGLTVAGFAARTKINREDFGATWNVALEAGGWLVGKEVTIEVEAQAVLQEETVPAQTATA